LTKFPTPIFEEIIIGFGHFILFYGYSFDLGLHFKKRIGRTLLQVFFAVENRGRDHRVVDTRRIFTQFLIPMSWAKTYILWLFPFFPLTGFSPENHIEFILVFLT
jgi:hypothetical protein